MSYYGFQKCTVITMVWYGIRYPDAYKFMLSTFPCSATRANGAISQRIVRVSDSQTFKILFVSRTAA